MPRKRTDAEAATFTDSVAVLARTGHTDREIALLLGASRKGVTEVRRVCGLPYKSRLERRQGAFAAAYGLPVGLHPRQVQICVLLGCHGALSRRELSDGLGLRWSGGSRAMSYQRGSGGNYLTDLLSRGLACVARPRVFAEGLPRLYMLSGVALEIMASVCNRKEVTT